MVGRLTSVSLALVAVATGVLWAGGREARAQTNLLANSTFDSGVATPWTASSNSAYASVTSYVESSVSGGVTNTTLDLDVTDSSPSPSIYDIQVGQPVSLTAGKQ